VIELRGVGHTYSEGSPWAHRALDGIDLSIRDGERLLVVGKNGSGKSTLAWILAGLLEPSAGSATIDGEPISSTRGLALISFQHARLQLFRPTVGEDIAFGAGAPQYTVDGVLREVGFDPDTFRGRRIDELSGGEQRRVALAGLLVRAPRVIVFDEPFAGLDAPSHRLLIDVVTRLACATVVVSHDVEDAHRYADRVLELHAGRIVREAHTI
jgi:energy-coupling factor transporter ATP-binding protein EcfA2